MDSDSESQDSDEGRRFRFETTRKDGQSRRKVSPERNRRRSRSRDRNPRDDRTSRRSRDRSSSRRGRSSPEERKDRKEGSSRRPQDKDHRSSQRQDKHHRGGGGGGAVGAAGGGESKNGREHRHKREKHKRRSRDRSSERSRGSEESERKREDKGSRSQSPSSEQQQQQQQQQAVAEKPIKSVAKSEDEKVIAKDETANGSTGSSSNPIAVVSDVMLTASAAPTSCTARRKPKSFFDRVVNKAAVEDDVAYGPALPPKLEKKWYEARANESTKKLLEKVDESRGAIGPALPPSLGVSSAQKDVEKCSEEEEEEKMVVDEEEEEEEEDDASAFGPALPPHMERRRVVGPVLPDNFVVPQSTDNTVEVPKPDESENEDDEDDSVVGPLPADHPAAKDSYVQMQLEYRALKVKEKFMNKTGPEKNKREEWMTELPPAHAVAIGLGPLPRKFKTREGPDMSDRSMWTDTPADRLRKEKEKEENRFVPSQETSKKSKKSTKEVVPEEVEEPESLLDMHLKNMKKKKKKAEKEAKESGLPTRRPFDRDTDLQVNRLDNAKKKKIFDKARMLNDRFAPGKI